MRFRRYALISRMQGGRFTQIDEARVLKYFFFRRTAERHKLLLEQSPLVQSSQLLVNTYGIGSWFEILKSRRVTVYVQSNSGL